jgi:hypothetical protein
VAVDMCVCNDPLNQSERRAVFVFRAEVGTSNLISNLK